MEAELNLPLESERQIVYILVQIRKLLDRDQVSKTEYMDLRMFCNWAVHSDLSNPTVKRKLQLINDLGWNIPTNQLTPEQLMKCSELLSLETARTEFVAVMRAYKLNSKVRHVFEPVWWADLLRQYFGVISDCPLVFSGRDLKIKNIRAATITGYEILDRSRLGADIECAFEINWVIEFETGLRVRIPIPLEFEKATFRFGRSGRMAAGDEPLKPL